MDENKDKLTDNDKAAVKAAIDKVKEVVKHDDLAAINQAIEDLQRSSQAMAEHLYAASAAAGAATGGSGGPEGPAAGTGAGGGAGAKPDDVIDVEFEEKK